MVGRRIRYGFTSRSRNASMTHTPRPYVEITITLSRAW
jgi:hypothetical protein